MPGMFGGMHLTDYIGVKSIVMGNDDLFPQLLVQNEPKPLAVVRALELRRAIWPQEITICDIPCLDPFRDRPGFHCDNLRPLRRGLVRVPRLRLARTTRGNVDVVNVHRRGEDPQVTALKMRKGVVLRIESAIKEKLAG
jgi:hypothetical protein